MKKRRKSLCSFMIPLHINNNNNNVVIEDHFPVKISEPFKTLGGGYIISDKLAKLIIKRKIVYTVQQQPPVQFFWSLDVIIKLIIKS